MCHSFSLRKHFCENLLFDYISQRKKSFINFENQFIGNQTLVFISNEVQSIQNFSDFNQVVSKYTKQHGSIIESIVNELKEKYGIPIDE